jgi:hypothetical protein
MLLRKLSEVKGIKMNVSATVSGKSAGFSKQRTFREAEKYLALYIETGKFFVPYFMLKKKTVKLYKHDGDATANRNLWNTGWKSPKPKSNSYGGYNTKK